MCETADPRKDALDPRLSYADNIRGLDYERTAKAEEAAQKKARDEVRDKEWHETMASAQMQHAGAFTAGPGSMAGALHDKAANTRPSLRQRVDSAGRRAADRSAHGHNENMRLIELGRLLDRNPDVARILELIEQTGV